MPPSPSHADLRVLFITPEAHGLIKTGGLGDVSAALPAALSALDGTPAVDVRLLIPGYPSVLAGLKYKRKIASFGALREFPPATLISAKFSNGVPVFAIDCPGLYQREGGPYNDPAGRDWPDNALRFGLLSKIGAILASDASPLKWRPQIAHCNDWQAGLTPAYLHFHPGKKAATLMSIHNLAYQGIFPPGTVTQLGLPAESFGINGVEYYGNLSFLKAGLFYADTLTTVSPTYAQEIQRAPWGFGMQGLLKGRADQLSGIVNGIDTDAWNPATDMHIAQNYNAATLAKKTHNKLVLQQLMGLASADSKVSDAPLFGAIGRMTHQKGLDLIEEIAPQLIDLPAQLVILGSGDKPLEESLLALAQKYPGKIAVSIGFNESLSHLIEAGADCFLMPSRFEPCGLNQMYSQRYGTPPLVHGVGGLTDTVIDFAPAPVAAPPRRRAVGDATGFLFQQMTAADLLAAAGSVASLYRDKKRWRQLQKNGMARDFSWRSSASRYREIYESLLVA